MALISIFKFGPVTGFQSFVSENSFDVFLYALIIKPPEFLKFCFYHFFASVGEGVTVLGDISNSGVYS